jgi:succinate-acetate transporter protein
MATQQQQSAKADLRHHHEPLDIEAAFDDHHSSADAHAAVIAAAVPEPPAWNARIANPAPLGLLAFGMTTCFLMSVDAAWSGTAFASAVVGYAYAFGGGAQLIAGVLELLRGNSFAGTAFSSYGAFWISWAFLQAAARVHPETAFAPTGAALAGFKVGETVMLAFWGCFTFLFFVMTLRKNACLMVVFSSLAATFWLLAAGQWSHGATLAAGYVGVFCGLSAIYTAFAELYQEHLGLRPWGLAPVRFI